MKRGKDLNLPCPVPTLQKAKAVLTTEQSTNLVFGESEHISPPNENSSQGQVDHGREGSELMEIATFYRVGAVGGATVIGAVDDIRTVFTRHRVPETEEGG